VPSLITYDALISVCEKSTQLKRALEVFQGLHRHHAMPNLVTYNTLVSACAKGKQPELALRIFQVAQP